jgi:hypothetical protein
MSSRYSRHSRDTHGLPLDPWADLLAEASTRDEVNVAAQKVFEEELESDVLVEGGRRWKVGQDIDIAINPRLVSGEGAEEREGANPEATLHVREMPRQALENVRAIHKVASESVAAVCSRLTDLL